MSFYALSILRLLEHPEAARLLRPFAFAGRMPLSNYLLYGDTAKVHLALEHKVPVALGSDWSPTG